MNIPRSNRDVLVRKIESAVCFALVGWALYLIFVLLQNYGPLWRDEINTLHVSLSPTLAEFWHWLGHESFPPIWMGVMRLWIAVGLGETDYGLRWLGALTGLAVVAAVLWLARRIGVRWPLLILALFVISPVMFRHGTSLRAYGFGILGMTLMTGAVLAYIDRPSKRRLAWAWAFSLFAIHTLYYNSLVLFTLGIAGGVVLLLARRFRALLWLAILGITCALSITPYILGPLRYAESWSPTVTSPSTFPQILERFKIVLDIGGDGMHWVWFAAITTAFIISLASLRNRRDGVKRRRIIFFLIATPLMFVCQFLFLLRLGFVAQHWYFITLLLFTAIMIERAVSQLVRHNRFACLARIAVVLGIVCLTYSTNYLWSHGRRTHIDYVAGIIEKNTTPDDYIIVFPWVVGQSFDRYYHGSTPWVSLPPVTDFRFCRYDQLKATIMNPAAIQPILDKIRQTLESGHNVWYLGVPAFLPPGEAIPDLVAAPTLGWGEDHYDILWQIHTAEALRKYGTGVTEVNTLLDQPIIGEYTRMFIISGKKPAAR